MQNFGGTAKSILVFVKKAYSDIKGIEGNQSEVVVIVQKKYACGLKGTLCGW